MLNLKGFVYDLNHEWQIDEDFFEIYSEITLEDELDMTLSVIFGGSATKARVYCKFPIEKEYSF